MAFITTQRAKWTLELFLLLLEYSSKRLCRNSSQNDSYKKALELFLFNSVKTSYLRYWYFISRRNIIQTLKWPRLSSYIILLWTNCPSSKRKIARFGMTKRNESICTLKIKYKEKRNQLFRLRAILCQKQVFVRWCFYTITYAYSAKQTQRKPILAKQKDQILQEYQRLPPLPLCPTERCFPRPSTRCGTRCRRPSTTRISKNRKRSDPPSLQHWRCLACYAT